MTDNKLDILLTNRCQELNLKQKAFEALDKIFAENSNEEVFCGGFERSEIKAIFDGFAYLIDRRLDGQPIIRTRIGLYLENHHWAGGMEPIGYYELDTDFDGKEIDDWYVIEKEKYIKDIGIASHLRTINRKLPLEYLKRNHIQYEFVTYISLIGTLFMSKEFEGAGRFIRRAYVYLKHTDNTLFDKEYLKECKGFLKMIKKYLLTNNLVTDELRQELDEE